MAPLVKTFEYLRAKGYVHFFVVGVSGVLLHLFVTWFFTHFIFGLTKYFYSYLIGVVVALIYTFIMHTVVTFQTNSHHRTRFLGFIAHYVVIAFLQAIIVKTVTPLVGLKYYLLVIAATIFVLSNLTFFFFKFVLFRKKPVPSDIEETILVP